MAVIDAHAHLEPRMLEVPVMLRKLDALGVDRVVLIPTMNDPLPDTPAALLAAVRALMCSPLHGAARWLNDRFFTPEGHLELRGKVYEIYQRPDNATVARILVEHPDRFYGWVFLNPALPEDPVEELERWRHAPGVVGVKLHPHWHRYPLRDALPIARRCEELRLPLLVHLGFGERGAWQVLTDACPSLRLVFAHAGIPHYQRMWGAVRDNPNLHVDLSSPYLSERLVRRAVAAVGPHRALYGTDAPYGFHEPDHSYDYDHIKGWVHRLPVPARDIDRILGDNVETLLAEKR
jgi:predicted TIM-barrel fold metal-dependent hydrolase